MELIFILKLNAKQRKKLYEIERIQAEWNSKLKEIKEVFEKKYLLIKQNVDRLKAIVANNNVIKVYEINMITGLNLTNIISLLSNIALFKNIKLEGENISFANASVEEKEYYFENIKRVMEEPIRQQYIKIKQQAGYFGLSNEELISIIKERNIQFNANNSRIELIYLLSRPNSELKPWEVPIPSDLSKVTEDKKTWIPVKNYAPKPLKATSDQTYYGYTLKEIQKNKWTIKNGYIWDKKGEYMRFPHVTPPYGFYIFSPVIQNLGVWGIPLTAIISSIVMIIITLVLGASPYYFFLFGHVAIITCILVSITSIKLSKEGKYATNEFASKPKSRVYPPYFLAGIVFPLTMSIIYLLVANVFLGLGGFICAFIFFIVMFIDQNPKKDIVLAPSDVVEQSIQQGLNQGVNVMQAFGENIENITSAAQNIKESGFNASTAAELGLAITKTSLDVATEIIVPDDIKEEFSNMKEFYSGLTQSFLDPMQMQYQNNQMFNSINQMNAFSGQSPFPSNVSPNGSELNSSLDPITEKLYKTLQESPSDNVKKNIPGTNNKMEIVARDTNYKKNI